MSGEPSYNLSGHVVIPLGYFRELLAGQVSSEPVLDNREQEGYTGVSEPDVGEDFFDMDAWEAARAAKRKGPYLKRQGVNEGTDQTSEGSEATGSGNPEPD